MKISTNSRLLLWSLTVALCGFLFGLDTAVISGAEQTIQKLWGLSDRIHGLAISMALYGTVLGAMFGGFFADRLGRKKSLFWVGALFFVSALGSALAPGVQIFMAFRLIGGLCIGASSVVAPLYISEIAPPAKRGFLVALFQFGYFAFGVYFARGESAGLALSVLVLYWSLMAAPLIIAVAMLGLKSRPAHYLGLAALYVIMVVHYGGAEIN